MCFPDSSLQISCTWGGHWGTQLERSPSHSLGPKNSTWSWEQLYVLNPWLITWSCLYLKSELISAELEKAPLVPARGLLGIVGKLYPSGSTVFEWRREEKHLFLLCLREAPAEAWLVELGRFTLCSLSKQADPQELLSSPVRPRGRSKSAAPNPRFLCCPIIADPLHTTLELVSLYTSLQRTQTWMCLLFLLGVESIQP